jgi:hypothetical protein
VGTSRIKSFSGFIGLQPAQPDQLTLWLQMGTSQINSLSGFIGLR